MRRRQDAQDVAVRVRMASGRMAPSKAKSRRNVYPTLRPDSRLAFRRQVRQTHGTHRMPGIIFADVWGRARILLSPLLALTAPVSSSESPTLAPVRGPSYSYE